MIRQVVRKTFRLALELRELWLHLSLGRQQLRAEGPITSVARKPDDATTHAIPRATPLSHLDVQRPLFEPRHQTFEQLESAWIECQRFLLAMLRQVQHRSALPQCMYS